MRTAFFLLLLANAVFFAFHFFGDALFPGESNLLQQQIRPEAIKLLDPAEVAKTAKRERTVACIEWGAFGSGDLARADEAAAALQPGSKLVQRRVEDTATWWVFMPPQGSRQAAAIKTAELKRLGVDEFFILQDDPKFRFAISLGIFRTREAASNRLEQLRAKGVRTAQVGARDTQVQKTWLQARDAPESVTARLNELRQQFPGSEVRECAPEDSKG
jgi:hypothetical protein